MSLIKLKLNDKKNIVLFQFLYSQNQHLGWPRSDQFNPKEITIYTTNDLMKLNKEALGEISKYVKLEIIEY